MEEYRLTEEQRVSLEGQEYASDSYFSPFQDINNSWFISTQEVRDTVNEDYLWVKDLPLESYTPKTD